MLIEVKALQSTPHYSPTTKRESFHGSRDPHFIIFFTRNMIAQSRFLRANRLITSEGHSQSVPSTLESFTKTNKVSSFRTFSQTKPPPTSPNQSPINQQHSPSLVTGSASVVAITPWPVADGAASNCGEASQMLTRVMCLIIVGS